MAFESVLSLITNQYEILLQDLTVCLNFRNLDMSLKCAIRCFIIIRNFYVQNESGHYQQVHVGNAHAHFGQPSRPRSVTVS